MLLSKRFDRIKERTELSACNVFRSQRLLVYNFVLMLVNNFNFKLTTLANRYSDLTLIKVKEKI